MNAETITLQELISTESYKRNKLIYPHPKELCESFVNSVTEHLKSIPISTINVEVDKESGAGLEDGSDLKSYGRGVITIRFGEEHDGLRATIGLLWAYDIGKAYIKVFFGATASACTNLCIFGAENIVQKSFTYSKVRDEKAKEREWHMSCTGIVQHMLYMVEDMMTNYTERFNLITTTMATLKNTNIPVVDIYKFIGELYLEEVIKGTFDYSTWNEANRLMFNKEYLHPNKELYVVNMNDDDGFTLWQLYGALTQRLSDGVVDINLVADKTLEISNMILKYVAE